MSAVSSNSAQYYAEFISNHDTFLEKHIHRLTRIIRPQEFYTWLRKNGVFTQDDQEEVEQRYCTTTMKAGCLIDLIKTKGKQGFVAFMEVVEYSYPDLFNELTKKVAREPCEDFKPIADIRVGHRFCSRMQARRQQGTSVEMLNIAGELTQSLMSLLATKKEELNELTSLTKRMQTEQAQIEEDNATMYDQLRASQEQRDELNEKIKSLDERLRQVKEELEKEQKQSAHLRNEKDTMTKKWHDLMISQSNNGDAKPQRTGLALTSTTSAGAIQKPTVPPKFKQEFASCKSKNPDGDSTAQLEIKWPVQKISALQRDIDDLKKIEHQLRTDKSEMQRQLAEYESKCQILQENSNKFLQSYEEMKAERDQINDKYFSLQKTCKDELAKKEQLEVECHKFEDRFRDMEETICNMKKEIEHRSRCSVPSTERRPSCQESPTKEKSLLGGMSKIATSTTNLLTSPAVQIDKSEDMYFKGFDCTVDYTKTGTTLPRTNMRTQPPSANGTLRPGKKDTKRQGSYLNPHPVVIYAPDHLNQRLLDYLKPQYETCHYDVCKEGDMTGRSDDVIVLDKKVSLADGTTEQLTVNTLKRCKGQKSILMPKLPVAVVAELSHHGIEPIIIIVKFKNECEISELSSIEEALDKYKLQLTKCETLAVDSSLENDFPKFAGYVQTKLDELILKHSFIPIPETSTAFPSAR